MKKYLIPLTLVIGLTLAGCQGRAQEIIPTQNSDYRVEKLFTVDSCTVYRFEDGRSRYFTSCQGSIEWREACGKNCHDDFNVPTSINPKSHETN